MGGGDILIGIDAGTSVIKAVAFDLAGRQIGSASVPNRYSSGHDGSATQSLTATWADCAAALRGLGQKVEHLAARTAASGVTAQGDGTWLVGKGNELTIQIGHLAPIWCRSNRGMMVAGVQ